MAPSSNAQDEYPLHLETLFPLLVNVQSDLLAFKSKKSCVHK